MSNDQVWKIISFSVQTAQKINSRFFQAGKGSHFFHTLRICRNTDRGAVGLERVETAFPHLFARVTLREDLDFSFQFLRGAPGAA